MTYKIRKFNLHRSFSIIKPEADLQEEREGERGDRLTKEKR